MDPRGSVSRRKQILQRVAGPQVVGPRAPLKYPRYSSGPVRAGLRPSGEPLESPNND